MKLENILYFCFLTLTTLISCNQTKQENQKVNFENNKIEKSKFVVNENFLTKHSESCNCSAQFELKDSSKLVHIKEQFYKSKTGHLYERTVGLKEVNGNLVDNEYFNGYFSQEVDPITFEPLNGWYAKDKNFVYYYRPISGGMQISKIENADTKTFNILKGHYKYAIDKEHYFKETEIIEKFKPSTTKLYFDKNGKVTKMTTNKNEYIFEKN